MDLVAVLKERSSMTSTAPRAQSIVEHYGVLPAVVDDVDGKPFSSNAPMGLCSQELAYPIDLMGRAYAP